MLTRLLCVLICRLAQPKPYRKRKWLDKISEKCGECPSSTWHLLTVHNGAKFLMGLEILHIYNFSKYFWNCGNFWSFYFYEKLPDFINFFTLEFWQFKKKKKKVQETKFSIHLWQNSLFERWHFNRAASGLDTPKH